MFSRAVECVFIGLGRVLKEKKEEEMKLWTLFISYRFGGHYCGVYTSIETARQVIEEMAVDMEIEDNLPSITDIESSLLEKDDFWYEFSDGTWIHIQEVSEGLVVEIRNYLGSLGRKV